MKTCGEIKLRIEEMLITPLTSEERDVILHHVTQCEECGNLFQVLSTAEQLMETHDPSEDDVSPEFTENLHMKLVSAKHQNDAAPSSWFRFLRPVFYFTMVACTLVLILFIAKPQSQDSEPVMISRSEVESGKPFTVKLKYDALRDLAGVSVKITLDEEISFHSDVASIKELKEYVWKGDLKSGKNEIPFVIELLKDGEYKIETVAEFEGYRHKHLVVLKAEGDKILITYFEHPKVKLSDVS